MTESSLTFQIWHQCKGGVMPKIISCGIVPIRKQENRIEILLCMPREGKNADFKSNFGGLGFLKGQVEIDETYLEAAKREFGEESGDLEVEVYDKDTYFIQNNPKKKIYIWPAKVLSTPFNEKKIDSNGVIHNHDWENAVVKFFDIINLPPIFRNQQKILSDLIDFIATNKEIII